VVLERSRRARQLRHSGPALVRAATTATVAQNAHRSRREGWL